ncbi:hypothetical protein LL912_01690 [Niabella sp. CC-SYL272]|uniref:hypothetical protein n=1 Tax=Niabella agricola TaxID=2891571 RepID=UPI001F1B758A|nr:hypothetical protein [Niabella agricola]MCF3107481.1 hypothetical protein [Niabella agricola]
MANDWLNMFLSSINSDRGNIIAAFRCSIPIALCVEQVAAYITCRDHQTRWVVAAEDGALLIGDGWIPASAWPATERKGLPFGIFNACNV